jgi:hypothetical protein
MLRQFARRVPIIERLRVGFAAAGPAAGIALAALPPPRYGPTAALASTSGGNAGAGSSGGQDDALVKFQALFAEARDEIEYAREDSETTYFNESVQTARQAVDAALAAWADALNNQPDDAARQALVRGGGLKVEQLKAELQALDEIHA